MSNGKTIRIVCERDELTPFYANEGDAGADLFAKEKELLIPGTSTVVGTGVRMEIPKGYVGLVCPRSGLSRKGITVANAPGIIDSSYRGEIGVNLYYRYDSDSRPYIVEKGDRIAQLVIVPVLSTYFEKVEELSDTQRGQGGFGSTGK